MKSTNDTKFETLLPIFTDNTQVEYNLINKLNKNLFSKPIFSDKSTRLFISDKCKDSSEDVTKANNHLEPSKINIYPSTPKSTNNSTNPKININLSSSSHNSLQLITPISSPPIEKFKLNNSKATEFKLDDSKSTSSISFDQTKYSIPTFTINKFVNNNDNNQYIHSRSNSINNNSTFLTPPPSVASTSDNEDDIASISSDADDSLETTQEVMTIASKIPLFRRRKNNYINKSNVTKQNGPVILKLCKVNFNINKRNQLNQLNQLNHINSKTISTKQRKFLCKTCSMAFTTSGHLTRHNKIHTGEKNFVCPQKGCEQRFSRHDNCLQHYRTHLKKLNK